MKNYDNSFEDYDISLEDDDNSFDDDDNSFDDDDNSFDDDDSCGNDYCDVGYYEQSSGSIEDHSFNGCLNEILIVYGVFMGIGGLLLTLICAVPNGNMGDILGGFAISATGLLALWWFQKRK